jgi:Rrf2 family protein
MNVSQKCQYALRAIFELSKRVGQGPIRVGEIAEVQAIPPRFLEIILGQLKQAGYVQSRRGARGGYFMAVDPAVLSVGEIIRFIDGPFAPVKCIGGGDNNACPLRGKCAFMGLWGRAQAAVEGVYDSMTFEDLIREEKSSEKFVDNYCI